MCWYTSKYINLIHILHILFIWYEICQYNESCNVVKIWCHGLWHGSNYINWNVKLYLDTICQTNKLQDYRMWFIKRKYLVFWFVIAFEFYTLKSHKYTSYSIIWAWLNEENSGVHETWRVRLIIFLTFMFELDVFLLKPVINRPYYLWTFNFLTIRWSNPFN